MNFAAAHIDFADSRWLWLAVLGPLALWLAQRHAASVRARRLGAVCAAGLQDALLRSLSPGRRSLKEVLLLGALAFVALGLASPRWGEGQETESPTGPDVIFLVDCSRSMLAKDTPPHRLAKACAAILDLVGKAGFGRIGLVAFAGQAFLQCPLTQDHGTFEQALLDLDERTIPVPGTDLGRALEEGAHALGDAPDRPVLVLISDGEDLEKSGVAKARELGRRGITIFTVGVGTTTGGLVPGSAETPAPDAVLLDRQGRPVESRLDEATLRAIAEAGSGTYQPLGSLGEGLLQVRRRLDDRKANSRFEPTPANGVDRFRWPITAAVILWVVESLVGNRRTHPPSRLAPRTAVPA